ncbi:unnamed protein product [Ambrosiozyma monospora]|uniref:Unnamed protein product n=1 Tax=Ambrosiozyma monospora TaxID=43982 RepID=A0ACB5U9F9_AMBMO|nr:unnamed protein product [Ambrosiozyma monospora]
MEPRDQIIANFLGFSDKNGNNVIQMMKHAADPSNVTMNNETRSKYERLKMLSLGSWACSLAIAFVDVVVDVVVVVPVVSSEPSDTEFCDVPNGFLKTEKKLLPDPADDGGAGADVDGAVVGRIGSSSGRLTPGTRFSIDLSAAIVLYWDCDWVGFGVGYIYSGMLIDYFFQKEFPNFWIYIYFLNFHMARSLFCSVSSAKSQVSSLKSQVSRLHRLNRTSGEDLNIRTTSEIPFTRNPHPQTHPKPPKTTYNSPHRTRYKMSHGAYTYTRHSATPIPKVGPLYRYTATFLGATMWFWIFYRTKHDWKQWAALEHPWDAHH